MDLNIRKMTNHPPSPDILNYSQLCVVKVKPSMARSLPVENLLPQNVESIINYLLSLLIAQWLTPSCSRPQEATDSDVRDGRSN